MVPLIAKKKKKFENKRTNLSDFVRCSINFLILYGVQFYSQ